MQAKEDFNPFNEANNKLLLDELCIYISNNLDRKIGWTELVAQSKLTHVQLQFLFNKHFQTTPMTYIRRMREDSHKSTYADKVKYNTLAVKN